MALFLVLAVANIAVFVVYKRFRDRNALAELRLPFIVAMICGALVLAVVGEPRGAGEVALTALAAQQLWWGHRELLVDPSKPAEPARVASFSSAGLMLGSIVGVGVLALPDPRGFLAILIAGVFGFYWLKTRSWPRWNGSPEGTGA